MVHFISRTFADVAELVDALDLGSSVFDVRVRVSPSAFILDLIVRVFKEMDLLALMTLKPKS